MKPKRQEDSSCVFAYYFVAALATAAIPQEKKTHRNQFGAGQEINFVKAVGTIRQENRPGRGKLPPCMPQSECGAGHTGYRASLDPSPGGSQDTGGAFRSRVQRHGVRGCSHEQRSKTSIPQRTDLAQVKRDRHTGKPRKTSKPKTTRRGKNEGSVYRRKDGKWVGQVTVGYHPDTGKPIRKYTYASTREEAAHWIALTLVSETSKAVSLRWHPNCC